MMLRYALAVLASCVLSQAAFAADVDLGDGTVRKVKRVRIYAPYEHVVEVSVHPPGSRYVINGRYWTGTSPACYGWGPKQRVHMIAGEWHGACSTAIIRNVTLRRTCEFVCG